MGGAHCACRQARPDAAATRSSQARPRAGRRGAAAAVRLSDPASALEREADRVADRIAGGAALVDVPARSADRPRPPPLISRQPAARVPTVMRRCAGCEADEEELQLARDARATQPPDAADLAQRIHRERSRGRPLDAEDRAFLEPRFGADFRSVRIHDDTRAAGLASAVGARAFTAGRHVFFARGALDGAGGEARSHLLAHELTHVVQQTGHGGGPEPGGGGGALLLQRQGGGGGGESGAGGAGASGGEGGQRGAGPGTPPAAPLTPEADTPAAPAPSGGGRVRRILVSCADQVLVVETTTTRYGYETTECVLPSGGPGDYTASVTVRGNDFHLKFPTLDDEIFELDYWVLEGQENPATLLAQQGTVPVSFVGSLLLRRHDPGCMRVDPSSPVGTGSALELPARVELTRRKDYASDLFAPIHLGPRTVFKKRIPLAEFGWITISGIAEADITGKLNGYIDPVTLEDLCFVRMVSGGGLAANARLTVDAALEARIEAEGRFTVAGKYLSVFRLAAIEGALHALGTARADASLEATLEVLRRRDRTYRATGRLELALGGALGFQLDASAAIELLGRTLWRNTWHLVDVSIGTGWRGGLEFSPDFGLRVLPGEFGEGVTAGSVEGTGGRGRRRRGRTVSLPQTVDRLMKLDPSKVFHAKPGEIVRGPVCRQSQLSARTVGRAAHDELESQFRGSGRFTEVRIPFASGRPFRTRDPSEPRGAIGKADLVEVITDSADLKRIAIGEIKPMNVEGLGAGVHEVFNQYGPKVAEYGPECATPREQQDRPVRNFCDDIQAQGKRVALDDDGVSWSPSPAEFTVRLERPMRMFGKQMQKGVTGYKCIDWETPQPPAGGAGGGEGAPGEPAAEPPQREEAAPE